MKPKTNNKIEKKTTFTHNVSGRNRVVIISGIGEVGCAQAITLSGVKVAMVAKKRFFVFNRNFPFIHLHEQFISTVKIGDEKKK